MNKYTFACDPVANPSSVDGASVFAINRNFARPEFSVKDNGDQLETITPNIHVRRAMTHGRRDFVTLWLLTMDGSQTMLFNGNGTVAARTRNDRLDGDVFCCGQRIQFQSSHEA
ncbi:hypothetical protein E4U37_007468 [Claviceps purpurea]|nr:hypothetical protein E4U37_007468 [Claviceps purpurea]